MALGGPAMWAIAALSVALTALVLWKIWRLVWFGAWSGGRHSAEALDLWARGDRAAALEALAGRHSLRARMQASPLMDPAGIARQLEDAWLALYGRVAG